MAFSVRSFTIKQKLPYEVYQPITGGGGGTIIMVEDVSGSGRFYPTFVDASGNVSVFKINSYDMPYIYHNRSLGIGTDPDYTLYTLDVSGSAFFSNTIRPKNITDKFGATGPAGKVLSSTGTGPNAELEWIDVSGAAAAISINDIPADISEYYLVFVDGSGNNKDLYINDTLRPLRYKNQGIGIGVTPLYSLDVCGNVGFRQNLDISGGIYAQGLIGNPGQVLTSDGNVVKWENIIDLSGSKIDVSDINPLNIPYYLTFVDGSGSTQQVFINDTFAPLIYQNKSIGIGKTPIYNLDVSGDVGISNDLDICGGIYAQGTKGISGEALLTNGNDVYWGKPEGTIDISDIDASGTYYVTFINVSGQVERLFINSPDGLVYKDGRFGIGRIPTAPYTFDVSGSGRFSKTIKPTTITDVNDLSGNNGQVLISTGNGIEWKDINDLSAGKIDISDIDASGTYYVTFVNVSGEVERLFINSPDGLVYKDGIFGIGRIPSAPYTLDVSGSGRFSKTIKPTTITDVNDLSGNNGQVLISTGNGIEWKDINDLSAGKIDISDIDASGTYYVTFTNVSGEVERLFINSPDGLVYKDGRFGIGKVPNDISYNFDVSGSGRFSKTIKPTTITDVNDLSGNNGQVLISTGNGIEWKDINDLSAGKIDISDISASGTYYMTFVNVSGEVERLFINSFNTLVYKDQKVGIRTSNPEAFLDVSGSTILRTEYTRIGVNAGIGAPSGAIAVGNFAGNNNQISTSIAIGNYAGSIQQQGIAIGERAGCNIQSLNAIAIGTDAGESNQLDQAIAIGFGAGKTGQQINSIAIGADAGNTFQGENSIAVGFQAGFCNQKGDSIAIGYLAASNQQSTYCIAIGHRAGENLQKSSSIAIGYLAGSNLQDVSSVAIGNQAGQSGQKPNTVAIGGAAGLSNQGTFSVAIGSYAGSSQQNRAAVAIGGFAGYYQQDASSVAIGYQAGFTNQSTTSIAIGYQAGQFDQRNNAIAIGNQAGLFSQQIGTVAIGEQAGYTYQGQQSIAIGQLAGSTSQSNTAVAIGAGAGKINQGPTTVAIGSLAGESNQQRKAIAIGENAGQCNQGTLAISIGSQAGVLNQGTQTIAIGNKAGNTDQSDNAIAIGFETGYVNQRFGAVAVGYQAGYTNQGTNSIAIGYQAGYQDQSQNTIVINSTGSILNTDISNALYIAPVRPFSQSKVLGYNLSTKEVTYFDTPTGGGGGVTDASTIDISDISAANRIYYPTFVDGSGNNKTLFINGTEFEPLIYKNRSIGIGKIPVDISYALDVSGSAFFSNTIRPKTITDISGLVGTSGQILISRGPSGIEWGDASGAAASLSVTNNDGSGTYYVTYVDGDGNNKTLFINSPSGLVYKDTRYGIGKVPNDVSYNFDVSGSGRFSKTIKPTTITDLSDLSGNYGQVLISTGNGIEWKDINDLSAGKIDISDISASGTYYMTFVNVSGEVERLFINSFNTLVYKDQKVGIRTSDPQAFLDVSGSTILRTEYTRIGINAGLNAPSGAIAIGNFAGTQDQSNNSIAIGNFAGQSNQHGIAIGSNAGAQDQSDNAIAIGEEAGRYRQRTAAVAFGHQAGFQDQGTQAIAIGLFAGYSAQGTNAISIGTNAGLSNQNPNTIAIGRDAGKYDQSNNAIAIGFEAGSTGQRNNAVAIGNEAGKSNQGTFSIAIGNFAATTGQFSNAIAIGNSAGRSNQGTRSIAIGFSAGSCNQNSESIAIGYEAGSTGQGQRSVAIGYQAGYTNQRSNAIAIGYQAGLTNQHEYSIVINAQDVSLNTDVSNALFIAPIRGAITQSYVLGYDITRKEVTYFNTPTGGGGGATDASTIDISDISAANRIYYPTFVDGSGNNKTLFINGTEFEPLIYKNRSIGIGKIPVDVSYALDVSGSAFFSNTIKPKTITDASDLSGTYGQVLISTGDGIEWKDPIDLSAGKIDISDISASGTYYMTFVNVSGEVERLFINSFNTLVYKDQRVGIRTSDPQAFLDVSGSTILRTEKVRIGVNAGLINQGDDTIALGNFAGLTGQQNYAIAIGSNAGQINQGPSTIAIGNNAGFLNQDASSIAIGYESAFTGQYRGALSVGYQAGQTRQGTYSIAIGTNAGAYDQSGYSIALGYFAGFTNQQESSIAIGVSAGTNNQNGYATAIGYEAGYTNQGEAAVAIGSEAGYQNQGIASIAIGSRAGPENQHDYSIVINAQDVSLNTEVSGALYIAPIRNFTQSHVLGYDTTRKEVTYFSSGQLTTDIYSVNFNTVTSALDVNIGPDSSAYYFPFPTSGAGASEPVTVSALQNSMDPTGGSTAFSPLQYMYTVPVDSLLVGGVGYIMVCNKSPTNSGDISASIDIMRKPTLDDFINFEVSTTASSIFNTDVLILDASDSSASKVKKFEIGSNNSIILNKGDLILLRVNLKDYDQQSNCTVDNPTLNGTLYFKRLGTADISDLDLSGVVYTTTNQTINGFKTFIDPIIPSGGIQDINGNTGADGQVLTSTPTGVLWADVSGATSISITDNSAGDLTNYYPMFVDGSGNNKILYINCTQFEPWIYRNRQIGIGKSPSYTLDVSGDVGISDDLDISGGIIAQGSYGISGEALLTNGDVVYWGKPAGKIDISDVSTGSITYYTNIDASGLTDTLFINSGVGLIGQSGRVGIGRVPTNSLYQFDVSGSARFSDTIVPDTITDGGGNTGTPGQVLTSTPTGLQWKYPIDLSAGKVDISDIDASGTYYVTFVNISGEVDRLFINSFNTLAYKNQRLGIRTGDPQAFLDVSGSTILRTEYVRIGVNAGLNNQDISSIAIGNEAGRSNQGTSAIAIGSFAGNSGQGQDAIAIGRNAGFSNATPPGGEGAKAPSSIAIGTNAGYWFQGDSSFGSITDIGRAIAIGSNAGYSYQGTSAIAIGTNAGATGQSNNSLAIGTNAGLSGQNQNAIAIGRVAGASNQGIEAVAVGFNAGATNQGTQSIAIGTSAGLGNQGTQAIAIGIQAGSISQRSNAVAIGYFAGINNQGTQAISIGFFAGGGSQGTQAVAIGTSAGRLNQGVRSVAIGSDAGYTGQGTAAIAIGSKAAPEVQQANSIVINAQDICLNADLSNALYIAPIRLETQNFVLGYNTSSKEVSYFTTPSGGGGSATSIDISDIDASTGGITYYPTFVDGSGNSKQMFINSFNTLAYKNQRLGIRTGTPEAFLDVSGSTILRTEYVRIGVNAGASNQDVSGIAIGNEAGRSNQRRAAIAIGANAGNSGQGTNSIAIGRDAGGTGQSENSVAIGSDAGRTNQSSHAIAIGTSAGATGQGSNCIAIGQNSGYSGQLSSSIAIGSNSGYENQRFNCIAIGQNAGYASQGFLGQPSFINHSIAIGTSAGQTDQAGRSIAIGFQAGQYSQSYTSVAIGFNAAQTGQADSAIAIGANTGFSDQGADAIAIGSGSGREKQSGSAIAIGNSAGSNSQGASCVAIGTGAGQSNQRELAISIGNLAGNSNQGTNAIAIGFQAGQTGQGSNCIAIGNYAGRTNQIANSIVINADVSDLSAQSATLYIKPIRSATKTQVLGYDFSSGEVTYQTPFDISEVSGSTVSGEIIFRNPSTGARGLYGFARVNGLGDVTARSVNTTSDRNMKTNIKPLSNIYSEGFISKLNPVEYNFKNDKPVKHLGFIAQEVDCLVKHVENNLQATVGIVPEDKSSMNYLELIAPIVKTLQELLTRVKVLEEKINKQ